MRKIITVIILFCIINNYYSQRHEIGFLVGNPNVIADIGKLNYIQPIPASFNVGENEKFQFSRLSYSLGFIYRYNFSPRQTLRLNLGYHKVQFDDRLAREDYRIARNKNYQNNTLIEGSIVYEYYFFEINDEIKFAHSPYIFGGFGAFMYKDRNYNIIHRNRVDASGNPITPTSDTDFVSELRYDEEYKSALTIPFGIGYKIKFNYNWLFNFEIGVRGTNTDRIDYSFANLDQYSVEIEDGLNNSPFDHGPEIIDRNLTFQRSNQTGNLKSTDWYVVTGIGLTYTFGRPPCFCD